jgi:hypothetical protein
MFRLEYGITQSAIQIVKINTPHYVCSNLSLLQENSMLNLKINQVYDSGDLNRVNNKQYIIRCYFVVSLV